MFVAARSIEFNTNYYEGNNVVLNDKLVFELSNTREVSANFVKLADLKQKHEDHALYGSSISSVGVYLVYPESDIKSVFSGDCGSRLKEDGTLVGRLPALNTKSSIEKQYEFETCGYLECHVSKNRSVPTVYVVYRGEEDMYEYALEKANMISSLVPDLKVEIL